MISGLTASGINSIIMYGVTLLAGLLESAGYVPGADGAGLLLDGLGGRRVPLQAQQQCFAGPGIGGSPRLGMGLW